MKHTIVKDFEILLHDVDHTGSVRLTALCNYMQAAADFHSRSLGTSMLHLEEINLTWVYARFRLEIVNFPRCYETVTVKTWRSRMEGSLGYREFELRDKGGSPVGAATSAVALIDRGTRKAVPIPEDFSRQFSDLPGSALGGEFERLPDTDEKTSDKKIFPVMMQDIDRNGHVNNVSYISWMLESSPEKILRGYRCHTLEVQYRAEAFFGSPVEARIQEGPQTPGDSPRFLHTLHQKGEVTTRALSRWKSLQDFELPENPQAWIKKISRH